MRCKHCLHRYDRNESKSEFAGGEDGLKKHLEMSHGLMGWSKFMFIEQDPIVSFFLLSVGFHDGQNFCRF